MITFITHVRVRQENAAAFEALLSRVCEQVRENEPGVIHYDFARSARDPSTYVVIEVYRDAAAVAVHGEADYVRESVPRSASLIEGESFAIEQYVSPGVEPVTPSLV